MVWKKIKKKNLKFLKRRRGRKEEKDEEIKDEQK